MVRAGERFYTSLGFDPLPPTFWERSLFVRPKDRDVVCHASAWDLDLEADVRIKMCINPTAEDFTTIHHELGHNFYQRAYMKQPVILRDSANDGFHEAVGDTISLSVTPEYLVKIGLLGSAPDASRDNGLLLRMALERFAFLPFALVIDQWRWKVFSGEVTPAGYNKAWWDLRLKYQGVAPPSPGARSSSIRARNTTCRTTRRTCAISSRASCSSSFTARCRKPRAARRPSTAARFSRARKPASASTRCWPWACPSRGPTRSRPSQAPGRWTPRAILDYFAPLSTWLDQQLAGKPAGW